MANEAETCRAYVVPKLIDIGWDAAPRSIGEQVTFTDGRIIVAGTTARRLPRKRADYVLRYTRDFPVAVVEAKAGYKLPGHGLQQAKDYAEILGVTFAYATNGHGIVEFDYSTDRERELGCFPTPEELWRRLKTGQDLSEDAARSLVTPSHHLGDKSPRYYQEIAINRVVQAVLQGRRRILLTMATGTGKTFVAFQICWKLWNARWNRTGEHRRPKVLYLADRNILVDDPKDKDFAPFGEARWKIEHGAVVKSRELYFASYQALAKDERHPGLYREYARDFFDLIVVDECHRGSAGDESNWREILEYFRPAYQLGMTATPLRSDNRDTYRYFGNPIYQYSLRQGIADGFLAPYRVHRVVTAYDAAGWRPSPGQLDRYDRPVPDQEYHTKDFEREVALRARTEAIARHLTDFMRRTDRFAKTIVFCVDQEHADAMRRALNNLNADLVRQHPDYVCRVTADEGQIGRGHLSNFQDLEKRTPVILTTSQLLTTGVDAPTCKNVVLARVVGSMTEFKQIIGRGTRVRDDYGKLAFNILDYTGSATRHFADPEFDGDPELVTEITLNEDGTVASETSLGPDRPAAAGEPGFESEYDPASDAATEPERRRKYYVDGGHVEIAAHLVFDLGADGTQLRVIQLTEYAAEKVRTLYADADEIRGMWAHAGTRATVIAQLAERGIDLDDLAATLDRPDDDPLDVLCHLAYNAPLRTRRERAERLRTQKRDFFDQYGPEARAVLGDLLDKYAQHGPTELAIPQALQVPPISERGNVLEIAELFGGAEQLGEAVFRLETLLYAA